MDKKQQALEIIKRLKDEYPDADCTLDYDDAWKLLVSVRLAAQCTDERVNIIVEKLYEKYPYVKSLADADEDSIEAIVRPCGLGRSKAKDISACMKIIWEKYGGKVPDDFDALLKLPGVGRKTANVIASVIYDKPVIAVDTHVFRVSRRIGLSEGSTVEAVEKDLTAGFAPELRGKAHHWLILHGRYVCTARKPKCQDCGLQDICNEYKLNNLQIR